MKTSFRGFCKFSLWWRFVWWWGYCDISMVMGGLSNTSAFDPKTCMHTSNEIVDYCLYSLVPWQLWLKTDAHTQTSHEIHVHSKTKLSIPSITQQKTPDGTCGGCIYQTRYIWNTRQECVYNNVCMVWAFSKYGSRQHPRSTATIHPHQHPWAIKIKGSIEMACL